MSASHLSLVLTVAFATSVTLIPARLDAIFCIPPNSQDQGQEREFENATPKHVPIRIRIKPEKEKSFKDMKNDRWLRDLEIEVKNTGTKPIYFLDLELITPDTISPSGNPFGWGFLYGRGDLVSVTEQITPKDVPLQPGETYTFSIAERFLGAWEKFVKEGTVKQPKKVRMIFQFINFGDGTGYWGGTAAPLPHPTKPTR